jgi:hypothetical protein
VTGNDWSAILIPSQSRNCDPKQVTSIIFAERSKS